jgi:aryl-alcohol dehydrogenase-like predicted oxidoreductase
VLPIPGTSSVDHLEQNVAAAALRLTDDDLAMLDRQPRPRGPARRVAGKLRRPSGR